MEVCFRGHTTVRVLQQGRLSLVPCQQDPHDDPESLSFKEFFDNVSGCSRASDKNTLRVFFKVMDEDHDGKILRSQVRMGASKGLSFGC